MMVFSGELVLELLVEMKRKSEKRRERKRKKKEEKAQNKRWGMGHYGRQGGQVPRWDG